MQTPVALPRNRINRRNPLKDHVSRDLIAARERSRRFPTVAGTHFAELKASTHHSRKRGSPRLLSTAIETSTESSPVTLSPPLLNWSALPVTRKIVLAKTTFRNTEHWKSCSCSAPCAAGADL
jgi:hypothetical protein